MKINIFKVKGNTGSAQSFHFAQPPQSIDLDDQMIKLEGDIVVDGEVTNIGSVFEIKGTITATVRRTCNRCLADYIGHTEISFVEKFQVEKQAVVDEDSGILWVSAEEVDIAGLVREALIVSEPMKPLCSEVCKGFCPKCGVNLNNATCSCIKDEIDPRLSILQKLLQKD